MNISVIIPAFNEEATIKSLYERIRAVLYRLGKEYEIIFVDDGSTDRTFQALMNLHEADRRLRVIKFSRNFGQTAALDAGFKAASGQIIITMDADGQNDPKDIPNLLAKLEDYDCVCGWRFRRNDPWLKRISSRIANFVRNKLSGEDIHDIGCSLKAYRRDALRRLKLYEGMHRFLPTMLKLEGFRVTEIKVSHLPREYGRSKYGIRNRLFKPFLDLLAVSWAKRRRLNYEVEIMK